MANRPACVASTRWPAPGLDVAAPAPANPLERAARVIEQRGWCQNDFFDSRGGVCLDFALLVGDPELNEAARRVVEAELRRRGGTGNVVRWNDDPGRSQEEVVELLRAAARHWPTGGLRTTGPSARGNSRVTA